MLQTYFPWESITAHTNPYTTIHASTCCQSSSSTAWPDMLSQKTGKQLPPFAA
jgi:hypothetical protein